MCYSGQCKFEKQNGDCKARPDDRCPLDKEEVVDPVTEKLDDLYNSLLVRNPMELINPVVELNIVKDVIKELILIVRNWE